MITEFHLLSYSEELAMSVISLKQILHFEKPCKKDPEAVQLSINEVEMRQRLQKKKQKTNLSISSCVMLFGSSPMILAKWRFPSSNSVCSRAIIFLCALTSFKYDSNARLITFLRCRGISLSFPAAMLQCIMNDNSITRKEWLLKISCAQNDA